MMHTKNSSKDKIFFIAVSFIDVRGKVMNYS